MERGGGSTSSMMTGRPVTGGQPHLMKREEERGMTREAPGGKGRG